MVTFDFPEDACDVRDRQALRRYREKASRWFEWLEGDPEHSIMAQLGEMLHHDALYRCFNECRRHPASNESASASGALGGFLNRGYVSGQVLAIWRLVDGTRDVVSLRRLIDELIASRSLITREIFVCHDGLPYDWQAAFQRSPPPSSGIWIETRGPDAWGDSMARHEQFDKLAGVSTQNRERTDLLPAAMFDRLRERLSSAAIQQVVALRNKRIAHAATQLSRAGAATGLNMNLIANAHRDLLQVTQAVQAGILYGSWMAGAIPVPQYDVFEHFEMPFAGPGMSVQLRILWDELSDERDGWLQDAMTLLSPQAH